MCSVISGNRNFEGRIHPLIKSNFLASPPLVVIFALTGKININFKSEPVFQVAKKKFFTFTLKIVGKRQLNCQGIPPIKRYNNK